MESEIILDEKCGKGVQFREVGNLPNRTAEIARSAIEAAKILKFFEDAGGRLTGELGSQLSYTPMLTDADRWSMSILPNGRGFVNT